MELSDLIKEEEVEKNLKLFKELKSNQPAGSLFLISFLLLLISFLLLLIFLRGRARN
jgi:hypothetical protein